MPPEKAEELVIANPAKIADMVEKISPVRPDKCAPVIPHSVNHKTVVSERLNFVIIVKIAQAGHLIRRLLAQYRPLKGFFGRG